MCEAEILSLESLPMSSAETFTIPENLFPETNHSASKDQILLQRCDDLVVATNLSIEELCEMQCGEVVTIYRGVRNALAALNELLVRHCNETSAPFRKIVENKRELEDQVFNDVALQTARNLDYPESSFIACRNAITEGFDIRMSSPELAKKLHIALIIEIHTIALRMRGSFWFALAMRNGPHH
jgi:hypothetical protein